MEFGDVEKINDTNQIEIEMVKLEKLRAALKKRKKKLSEKKNRFRQLLTDCRSITKHMDDWIKRMVAPQIRDSLLSILFLGACSGEWAARTRYRGSLPGFGGFMIVAGGKRILVDPGRSSFTQLMSQGFHPSSLAAVIATHSHWDCCRDLKPVVMAACPVIKENWRDTDDYPRLYADRSVLYGLEMDADGVIESSGDYGYFEKQDKERLARYKASLKDFHYSVPGVLTAYDLHFRLGGRFEQIEINHEYKISTNVDLYTRPSFHPIGHAVESIPALDFVVHQNGKPQARCVYLSDTEYRKELADIYAQDLEKLGPVDVLICNVKTLNVFEKPADDPYEGYTWKHLGWKGLLQLTKDFRERKILVPESLVVLRAWGLETVTNLDKLDKALIAAPEKLSVYEEEYKDQIDQNAVIPDITWVHVKDRQRPISIDHIRPPFRKREIYRRFGKVFYGSPAMEKVVQSAKAVTDDRNVTVLITGESGSGKDELAKGIHDEAVYTGKRSGKLIIRNAASLDTNLAEAILFGARKGAYTGLDEDMDGWLKEAEDGTLLIQEVANMPIHSQEKLLTCLQERKYQPIKGTKTLELTAQVIFTTNANLKEEVEKGTFSEPLRHRIGRYIKILPLRNRPEDILCIIEGLRREGGDGFENMPVFGDGAIALLQEYPWTGNVRQLIRVLERVTQSGDYSLKNIRTIVDEYDDDSPKLGPTPPRIDRDELEQNDDYKNILEFLKDGRPRKKKEIEQVLVNVKSATLMKRLNELIKEGLIKPIGNGPTRTYAATKKIKKQEI